MTATDRVRTITTAELPVARRGATASLPDTPDDPTDPSPRRSPPPPALVGAVIVVYMLAAVLGIVAEMRPRPAVITATQIAPTVAATIPLPASAIPATQTAAPLIVVPPIGTNPPAPPIAASTGSGGTLTATASHFLPASGMGAALVSWATPDGAAGQVWMSVDGRAETLFAQGSAGSQYAALVETGKVYEFRLYVGIGQRGAPLKAVTLAVR